MTHTLRIGAVALLLATVNWHAAAAEPPALLGPEDTEAVEQDSEWDAPAPSSEDSATQSDGEKTDKTTGPARVVKSKKRSAQKEATEPLPGDQAQNQAAEPEGESSLILGRQVGDYSQYAAAAESSAVSDLVLRFGWWGVSADGASTKVGEYQSLRPSPFADVDGLITNGSSTLNVSGSFLDQDASQVQAEWYRGTTKVDFGFERFPHELDHDPLNNFQGVFQQAPTYSQNPDGTFTLTNPGNTDRSFVRQDLNAGEDYVIRVEELRGSIRGQLSDNWKYGVRVWSLRRTGERQAKGAAHCFNSTQVAPGVPANPSVPAGRACHVLSQRQSIDWLIEEVEPSIEGKFGPVTVQYSHLVRAFFQDDQQLSRLYNSNAANRALTNPGGPLNGAVPGDYDSVPENLTHIGQLKASAQLTDVTDTYLLVLGGNTNNRQRETDRSFGGVEFRLSDRSFEDFTNTAYAKVYGEWSDLPPFLRPDESGNPYIAPTPWLNTTYPNGFVVAPWDYVRTTAGVRTAWLPYGEPDSWRLTGGYEFTNHDRRYAQFEAVVPDSDPTDPDITRDVEFDWGTTKYHTVSARASRKWTREFDSYVMYSHRWIDNPMFGVHEPNGTTNSNLPNNEDLVQIGGTWYPSDYFMLTCWFGIENRSADNEYAQFTEDNYPLGSTLWYAVTDRWHLSGGYAYFSNWIDQDITLGDQIGGFKNSENRIYLTPVTTQFNYGGQSHVVNVSSNYALRSDLALVGTAEFVDGRNAFDSPAQWPDLGTYSAVEVRTRKVGCGVDWTPYAGINVFCRYIYFDYDDVTNAYNSGTSNMYLGGVSAVY